jgi:protein MpaA
VAAPTAARDHADRPAGRLQLHRDLAGRQDGVDLAAGRSPRPVPVASNTGPRLSGVPIGRATSEDGRWAYTLYFYFGQPRELFLYALDTVEGRAVRVDLSGLENHHDPYALRLRRSHGGRELDVLSGDALGRRPLDLAQATPLVRIDTAALASPGPARPGRSSAVSSGGYAMAWRGVIGHSLVGRNIAIRQLGDPTLSGKLLVFGCIHGDECAGSAIEPLSNGCPDPDSDIFVVPSLNPDGGAHGSRLNGRGVDLNHNFAAGWKPIGRRWDLQYSGPHPFSEPETRLAAALVRAIEPEVTVWGQSVPAARHLAALAGMPFHLLPWPAGTAPNWQNHRFTGTSSFVVELPQGALTAAMEARLGKALVRLGRSVRED